jgi:hypothetical protein
LRLLCRAHNRHAAELAYGRQHVAEAIAHRRRAPAHARTRGDFSRPRATSAGATSHDLGAG